MITILEGDCCERLAEIPDGTFHCCVTSPPYWGLRSYLPDGHPDKDEELGLEPTPDLYVANLVDVFRKVRRVLRDDGVAWVNLGDSYAANRGNGASSVGDKQATNAGSLLGKLTCPDRLKPKDLVGIPWRVAFALQADGWWLRSDVIWHKPNCMPESVTDRPTKAHEYLFLLSKSARYFWDQDAVREDFADDRQGCDGSSRPRERNRGGRTDGYTKPNGIDPSSNGGRNIRSVWTIPTYPYSEAHFATFPPALVEPCIKAGTSERGCCPECGAPWERVVEKEFIPQEDVSLERGIKGAAGQKPMDAMSGWDGVPRGSNRTTTTGWRPTCDHDADPIPCRCLDPFGGAGTVGLVADRLGRDATLVELNAEYCEMAEQRVRGDAPLLVDVSLE